MYRILLPLLFVLAFLQDSTAQRTIRIDSPDGNISFAFYPKTNSLQYGVIYRKKVLIEPSLLKLDFGGMSDKGSMKTGKPVYRDTTESYDLLIGKKKHVTTVYKELVLPWQNKSTGVDVDIIVRVFNDGVAFRYHFKGPKGDSLLLTGELDEFRLSGNPLTQALFLPNYTSSHEGLYSHLPLSDVPADTLIDMPALFEFPGSAYLAITEAALLDYAGMSLEKKNNSLRSVLSPLPKEPAVKVKSVFPHSSPWRVLMIGDRMGTLIESNILTSLNAPSRIADTHWIRPGKTTFPWWNGNVMPDTINAPGNNFVTQQYYIDFCARNKIEYHSVVEYGLHQWYVDDGVGFQPGPGSDVTRPVPGLDMKEVCDYAASKGVGVRVWVHWAALYPRIDSAFAIFERWGLKGMMIDFMDRDDQEMVNIQTEMLEKAAAHHLHVQFHGAYKPTGLSRTYPNEFTREGAMNYEYNKWDKKVTPDHDLDIVFTRMLAGPTDYHMGGFRFVTDSLFRPQYTRPKIIGTRCHMLGLYVVLENYLGMVADYPEAYEGQPGFEFVKNVPTTWDDTKVPGAELHKYAVVARKKNGDWWLGAISNHQAREVTILLDFLGEGKYTAEVYEDGAETLADPNKLTVRIQEVDRDTRMLLSLAGNGGAAIHFREMK